MSFAVPAVAFVLVVLLFIAFNVLREYQRGVIFQLGRFWKIKGPGLINVIPIILPPLRERREDIALLARHFLKKSCREMKRTLMSLSPAAMRALEAYSWPGNVREMENVIERTVALTEEEIIAPSDLPTHVVGDLSNEAAESFGSPKVTSDGIDMTKTIEEIERAMIREALTLGNGVKARAAALLGINRTTLVEKIKRLKIEV